MKADNLLYAAAYALGIIKNRSGAESQGYSPTRPPAVPLAVRSPYLNTYLFADGSDALLTSAWPHFWAGGVTGWSGIIRVDDSPYTWMGLPRYGDNNTIPPPPSVNQTALSYTSTRSVFTMNVDGKVGMNITFFSPIVPDDLKRQSLTFSYLDVQVSSLDGQSHSVQLYADTSAEWASGDPEAVAVWAYNTTDNLAYHTFTRQTPLEFSEVHDQAEWGDWYWATDSTDNLTFQSGTDYAVRGQFATTGKLLDTKDTNFRAIDDDYPVFGFAKDLGTVTDTPVSVLYSIGLAQQNAVQFADKPSENKTIPSLWTAYFDDGLSALEFFHGDYSNACKTGDDFDQKVATDSLAKGGQDYLTITSLAARQAFGGLQLCGTLDQTFLFLKEISSDGNIQTVDVIFPTHPILLYTNPTLIKYLLEPLFINQESGDYPNLYSMHDLGAHYPNATGHPDGKDEMMPLEECGNMLIMTLAYVQATKDTDFLTQHYKLLDQWTQFLINDSLYPANQISTDDFAGALANQTNLAIKGMIGIAAMGQIANLTGNAEQAQNYSQIAQSYVKTWQQHAFDANAVQPHTLLAYDMQDTWGTLYNIFADKLLGLGVVPSPIYSAQAAYYPTVTNTYGLPLDSRSTQSKSDWEIWAAAAAPKDSSTRRGIVSALASFIASTNTDVAFTDLYDSITGGFPASGIKFQARPVQGGTFAMLLVE